MPGLIRTVAVAGAVITVLIPPLALAAPEPSKFGKASMKVFDARRLLNSWTVSVDLTQPIELTVQNRADALAFARKGFRVRAFQADANWRPVPYEKGQEIPYRVFPPCDVYLSSRWPTASASGFKLEFGPPRWLSWLAVEPSGKLADGHWLLIFEDGSDDHDVLRLNSPEATAYFAYAARLTVQSGAHAYTVADLTPPTEAQRAYLVQLRAEGTVNAPSRDCIHVEQAENASEIELASLEKCGSVQSPGTAPSILSPPGAAGADEVMARG